MQARQRTFPRPLVLFAAALCLFLGYRAVATRGWAPPQPVAAATIDLSKVFENLAERAAEDVRLQSFAEQKKKEDADYMNQIKQMEEDLENFPPGTEAFEQALRAYKQKSLEYDSWKKFTLMEIDREKGLVLQKIYRNIKLAIAEMAQQQEYDIVMLNDSLAPIQPGGEQEVNQQISARRLLYTNPALDITDELITRMNNRFNAPRQ